MRTALSVSTASRQCRGWALATMPCDVVVLVTHRARSSFFAFVQAHPNPAKRVRHLWISNAKSTKENSERFWVMVKACTGLLSFAPQCSFDEIGLRVPGSLIELTRFGGLGGPLHTIRTLRHLTRIYFGYFEGISHVTRTSFGDDLARLPFLQTIEEYTYEKSVVGLLGTAEHAIRSLTVVSYTLIALPALMDSLGRSITNPRVHLRALPTNRFRQRDAPFDDWLMRTRDPKFLENAGFLQ